ncbi:MAG: hypothetical protein U0326_14130 [Polyangiales bacterium]
MTSLTPTLCAMVRVAAVAALGACAGDPQPSDAASDAVADAPGDAAGDARDTPDATVDLDADVADATLRADADDGAACACGPGRACVDGGCDPAWIGLSSAGAPTQRSRFAMVWTGREVLVWGGLNGETPSATARATTSTRDAGRPSRARERRRRAST